MNSKELSSIQAELSKIKEPIRHYYNLAKSRLKTDVAICEYRKLLNKLNKLIAKDPKLRARRDLIQNCQGITKDSASLIALFIPKLGTMSNSKIKRYYGFFASKEVRNSNQSKFVRTLLAKIAIYFFDFRERFRGKLECLRKQGKSNDCIHNAMAIELLVILNSILKHEEAFTKHKGLYRFALRMISDCELNAEEVDDLEYILKIKENEKMIHDAVWEIVRVQKTYRCTAIPERLRKLMQGD
jgi:hypothetical protein